MKRSCILQNNLPKLYGLMWGHCTPGLQSELQGDPSYKEKSKDYDCLWLAETLKLNSSGIAHTSNHFHSAFHALKGVFSLRQGANESMDVFYKRFDLTLLPPHLQAATLLCMTV